MHYAIAVFDIGMLTKTADDQPLLRWAQQALIDIGSLFFQSSGLVGVDPALLAMG